VGTADGYRELGEAAWRWVRSQLREDDGPWLIVPHTIPPARREVEPLTYTWCHGPAGTSHLFAGLSYAGVAEVGGMRESLKGANDIRRNFFFE